MAVSVIQRIRNVYHNLSKGHKRVANLILRNQLVYKDFLVLRLLKNQMSLNLRS